MPRETPPLHWREDAAARRWLAARAMRVPLVVLKFGSPVLTIAALTVIVRQPRLAALPLGVLLSLALPFAVPFVLAAIYPLIRWTPQTWTIDAGGIAGRGRVSGRFAWDAFAVLPTPDADGPAGHVVVRLRRLPAWRHRAVAMLVPAAEHDAVAAWLAARGAPGL